MNKSIVIDRNLVFVALGRLVQIFIVLASIRLLTELLAKGEIGRVGLFQSLTGLISLLCIAPVSSYLQRRVIEWNSGGLAVPHIRSYWIYLAVLCVIAVPISMLVYLDGVYRVFPFEYAWLVFLLGGYLLFTTFNQTVTVLSNTLGYRLLFVVLSNSALILGLFSSVLLVYLAGFDAEYWLLGTMLGYLLMTPVIIRSMRSRLEVSNMGQKESRGYKFWSYELLSFSLPLLLSNGFYWIQINGYRFILSIQAGTEVVGAFMIGIAVGTMPLSIFQKVSMDYMIPRLYQDIAHSDETGIVEAWRKFVICYWPLVIGTAALVITLIGPISEILVAEEFRVYSYLAYWGVILQLLYIFNATYSQLVHALLITDILVIPNILGGVLVAVMSWFLIPLDPHLGLIAALIAGVTFSMVHVGVRLHRRYKVVFPVTSLLRGVAYGLAGLLLMLGMYALGAFQGFLGSAVQFLVAGTLWVALLFVTSKNCRKHAVVSSV